MVPSSCKGSEKDTSLKMVKEFVLIERQEYNKLNDIPTVNDIPENMDVTDTVVDTSMLSIQRLLNAVKSRVGIRDHNKVDNLFEFLKTHPLVLSWTDSGEAIVDGTRLPGSNVHDMLDYLFHNWRNYLNNCHHKVWIS